MTPQEILRYNQSLTDTYRPQVKFEGAAFYIAVGAVVLVAAYILSKRRKNVKH